MGEHFASVDDGSARAGTSCGWADYLPTIDLSNATVLIYAAPMMEVDFEDGHLPDVVFQQVLVHEVGELVEALRDGGAARVVLITSPKRTRGEVPSGTTTSDTPRGSACSVSCTRCTRGRAGWTTQHTSPRSLTTGRTGRTWKAKVRWTPPRGYSTRRSSAPPSEGVEHVPAHSGAVGVLDADGMRRRDHRPHLAVGLVAAMNDRCVTITRMPHTPTPTRRRPKRVIDCLWCSETFASVAEHLHHVHTDHADRLATGQRSRRTWTCWSCAAENAPTTDTCSCGWRHPQAVTS